MNDPTAAGNSTQRMKEWWEASAASRSMIADLCGRNGIAFGIIACPIGPRFSDGCDTQRAERSTSIFSGRFRARRDRKLFFGEIHLTPYGHGIAAREMVRRLENVIPVPGNRNPPISHPD